MKISFERPAKSQTLEDTAAYMANQLAHELQRITDLSFEEALQITSFWVKGTKIPLRPVKVTLPHHWGRKLARG